jgi:hypothetical protein
MKSWMKEIMQDGPVVKLKRKTPAQKKAYDHYVFCERQEDRYMGSVFVTPQGERDHRAKTKAAYDECVRLGMGVEHGL